MPNSNTLGSQPLRFSFVVPALNEAVLLAHLLDSIRSLEKSDKAVVHEIIVVDANSTDGTAELAAAGGCKVVAAERGNVSQSRNVGADVATGNVLAFIDADCELPADWMERVASALSEGHVAAGMNMASPGTNAPWVERCWFDLAHRRVESDDTTSQAKWLATFNLAVMKDAFELAGKFDTGLVTCEDVELGYRLNKLGPLCFVSAGKPSGVIHHGESKTLREFFRREAWRARGTLPLLKEHWKDPRELVSSLLPFVVVGSFVTGIVGATGVLSSTFPGLPDWHRILFAALGVLPLLLLTLRRRRFSEFIAALRRPSCDLFSCSMSWNSITCTSSRDENGFRESISPKSAIDSRKAKQATRSHSLTPFVSIPVCEVRPLLLKRR